MEKHENRRVAMTKRMIKEALVELLKEKDIHHIAITELCQRADVNRTTFYKYYCNQYAVLEEMEGDMIATVQRAIAESGNRYEKAICIILRYMEHHLELSRLLINNNVDPTFPIRLFSLEIIQQEAERVFGFCKDDPKQEYLCQFFFAGLYQILRTWLNKKDRDPIGTVAALMTEIYLSLDSKAR